MKIRTVFATAGLTLALIVASLATAANDTATQDQAALMQLEQDWNEATKNKDRTFFETNLSPDFTFVNERGEFSSGPAEYIAAVLKMPAIIEATSTVETVRIHSKTGVVTGRFSYKVAGGQAVSTRFTDTYTKGPGGWKAVASQETTTQ